MAILNLFLSAAKDLGITRVAVLVGVFNSKTHATSLSLFAFLFFSIFLFFITISIYHSIIYVYLSIYLPNYPYQHTYLPLPTYINIPAYLCRLNNTYQPMSTYHHLLTNQYQYLNINIESLQTQEPVLVLFNTYQHRHNCQNTVKLSFEPYF